VGRSRAAFHRIGSQQRIEIDPPLPELGQRLNLTLVLDVNRSWGRQTWGGSAGVEAAYARHEPVLTVRRMLLEGAIDRRPERAWRAPKLSQIMD